MTDHPCPYCDTSDADCTTPGCCDHCVTLGHAWLRWPEMHHGFWAAWLA